MERRLPVPPAPNLGVGDLLGEQFEVREHTLDFAYQFDGTPAGDLKGYLILEVPRQLRACTWQFMFEALESKANSEVQGLGLTVYKWSIVMLDHYTFQMVPEDWEVAR